MSSPLVSIAMCTYNGARFLEEQLDSIADQTYKNIELIIVDDCSTDRTFEIVQDYAMRDSRIKLFQNEQNLGFVKNFEKAISLCKGDYIALADQDDIWKPQKLEIFVEEIADHLLIYSDAILVDELGKEMGKKLIEPERHLIRGSHPQAFIYENCVSGNTAMFKKELTKQILPIPEEAPFHDWWIAFVASAVGSISYTDEALTLYRRHSKQITNKEEKRYSSPSDKLSKKEKKFLRNYEMIEANARVFSTLPFVDSETKETLETIISTYSTFDSGWFSLDMYKTLKKHNRELFLIKAKKRVTKRYLFRHSAKRKLLRLFRYSI